MTSSQKTLLWIAVLVFIIGATIGGYYYYYKHTIEAPKPVEETVAEPDLTGIPDFYISQADDVKSAVDAYVRSWRIHFFDVGQGDAILVQGSGMNILIDGGDRNTGIMEHLTRLAIDTLHWVFATHPHADHIAGLVPVLRTFPVLNVIDAGVSHSSALYRNYRALVDSAATTYTRGFAGWNYSFAGDFNMQVLHPDTTGRYDINNSSVVVRMQLGETFALFTGDAEHPAERDMLQRGHHLKSQILKMGHHGSKTSSLAQFLDSVKPAVGVILCGAGNKYNHPHTEALALMQQHNASIYQTDQHGSILVIVNETGYTIYPERPAEITPASQPRRDFVDINTADLQSLTRIVHIGEATARAIIENRPNTTLNDLQRVRGIGLTRLADIKTQGIAGVGEE